MSAVARLTSGPTGGHEPASLQAGMTPSGTARWRARWARSRSRSAPARRPRSGSWCAPSHRTPPARWWSPIPGCAPPATPRPPLAALAEAGSRPRCSTASARTRPPSEVDAGAAFAAPFAPDLRRRPRRRQRDRLRQGDQLPAHQRRPDGGLPGRGKARLPMLPSIGVPTTAGTGSEAQSYALISHAEDPPRRWPAATTRRASARWCSTRALAATAPRRVAAAAGIDAVSHAVESHGDHGAATRCRGCSRARPGACSTARCPRRSPRAARTSARISTRSAACSWAPTSPAPRSSTRCSAPPTPAPIR